MRSFEPGAFAFTVLFTKPQQRVIVLPYEDELPEDTIFIQGKRHLKYNTIVHEVIHALGKSIDEKPFIYTNEAAARNEAASEIIDIMSEFLGIIETSNDFADFEYKLDWYVFLQRYDIQDFKEADINDPGFHTTALAYAIQLLGKQTNLLGIKNTMNNITDLPDESNSTINNFYKNIFSLSIQDMDNFFITMSNILDEPEIREIIRPQLSRYLTKTITNESEFIQKTKEILLGYQGRDFT